MSYSYPCQALLLSVAYADVSDHLIKDIPACIYHGINELKYLHIMCTACITFQIVLEDDRSIRDSDEVVPQAKRAKPEPWQQFPVDLDLELVLGKMPRKVGSWRTHRHFALSNYREHQNGGTTQARN